MEIILSNHKRLLHPGIEKTIRLFKETFYYPDFEKLIQNIINECEICNQSKTEHRNTNHTFKITSEIKYCRDVYV